MYLVSEMDIYHRSHSEFLVLGQAGTVLFYMSPFHVKLGLSLSGSRKLLAFPFCESVLHTSNLLLFRKGKRIDSAL